VPNFSFTQIFVKKYVEAGALKMHDWKMQDWKMTD